MAQPIVQLKDQTALVTGAGRGMGARTAKTSGEQGATVLINDLFSDRAEEVVEQLRDQDLDVSAVPFDITDLSAVRENVENLERDFGGLDILVSNADVPSDGMDDKKFLDSTPADWQKFVSLKGFGLTNLCHCIVPSMVERKYARVVAITSKSWCVGLPMGIAACAASKAGAVGFIRHLAAETGRAGVTVNALSLGTMNNWGSDALAQKTCHVPRPGSPEDVGAAVAYFASNEASWVTAQSLPVNGGSLTA